MVWRKPSAMRVALLLAAAVRCAYIRDVDDAGFFLIVRSPGATRVLLANDIIVPFPTLEAQPNPKKIEDMGHFRSILEPVFWKLSFFFCGSGGSTKFRKQTRI